ncbi:NAD-binding protein [Halorhabdus sp. SVX81]|uniref:NAD-binding protein n=1 Tax=Halorhabdus sp. SVX81 TaxID=2978283 RepID=UPI0023DA9CDC|nr:NAD-binding protein [Halorhabdus sp. SVX81]
MIFALGVGAQLLAARLRLPSIIFYIAAGLAIGPLSGLVLPSRLFSLETFGAAPLSAIVGLSVAIIVFEGAFHLHIDRLREAPAATFRLVTLGAGIALVGTAVAVKFAFGTTTWGLSFLIGALLVATGPTVIAPILQVVPVRDRVAAALETEGIVNDVTAAITAVVVFEVIVLSGAPPVELLSAFAERLGQGILVGGIVAAIVYYLLRYIDLSPGDAPRNARLLVLAGAIVAYAGANYLSGEAGVAAAATAGIILGNMDIPYEEEITAFKGDVTLLVLSFVFITLAGILELDVLIEVGVPGLLVAVAVAAVIRPLLMFVSTVGGRFTFGERAFMSFVGPRGIIPASVATLFAINLQSRSSDLETQAAEATGETATDLLAQAATLDQQAQLLIGTVFLVILTTAVIEGGLARYIAQYLDVIPMRVIIVGGGRVGRALADRLEARGENVVIIEDDETQVEEIRNDGFTAIIGDGTDTDVLRESGANNAKTVVAATGDDDTNLLVAQLASTNFEIEDVIARANNPDNVEAFKDLGVRTISSSLAIAWAIDNQIERPAIAHWMTDVDRVGDVQEVEVTSEDLIGRTLREVGPELPDSCLIALVNRDGETIVPNAEFTIQAGDKVTLLGESDAVREGMAFCHPE